MLTLTVFQISLLAIELCKAAVSPQLNGKEIETTGFFVVGGHSADFVPSLDLFSKPECRVFSMGPGTPDFELRGIKESELSTSKELIRFIVSYLEYLRANPRRYRRVRVKGTLLLVDGYKERNGHGNGYGYRGLYQSAILVRHLEFID